MTYIIPAFLILFVVLLFLYRRIQWKTHVSKYKEFYKTPTPVYVPVLGNTYLMIGKNILTILDKVLKEYGNPLIGYIPHRTYFTSDPEEMKIILNQALDKSKEYDHLREVFGTGLVLAKAEKWKKNRKILSKGFKQGLLDMFVPTFCNTSNVLVEILRNKDYTDIYYLFEKYTLDVFCEATLGIKTSILTLKEHEFVTAITTAQRILFDRIGNIIKMNDFLFSLLPEGKLAHKLIGQMNDFLQDVINRKKAKILNENEITINFEGLPVLDILLEVAKKENFTERYISKEMVLFAAAATDTTAYSLAYAFCLLAMHPNVQEKVHEEVIRIVGDDDEIGANDIVKLKYTEMALNESMRLLPVVPIIARQAVNDIDLGTKVIPKDTGIIMSIIALHRDEKIYPDPLVYDPDRFLPGNVTKRHPYSFLPFSGGPRNCIGWKYAQMVMKTTIANVVRNFEIKTKYKSIDELKFESSVVMNTTHPMDLQFIPRKYKIK